VLSVEGESSDEEAAFRAWESAGVCGRLGVVLRPMRERVTHMHRRLYCGFVRWSSSRRWPDGMGSGSRRRRLMAGVCDGM
jgi:hypothetical protein